MARRSRPSRKLLGVVIAGLWLVAVQPLPRSHTVPAFSEVCVQAGVQFWQQAVPGMPMGGGNVWADIDADGDDDLYSVQATGCNLLFRNDGNGSFTRIVGASGASDCSGQARGATAADYDNDGDQDIYVTNNGQNRFYKNMLSETGTVSFVDFTVGAGMDGDGEDPSASAVWGDFDADGFLDLYVGNHASSAEPLICHPDLVYWNNGDGSFDEAGAELGIALSGDPNIPGCGLAATWSDYDDDGDLDLMVVNDFGAVNVPNRLFRNDGPGGLPGSWLMTDVSVSSGFDYAMFGMGIAIGDLDLDGDFDYYMSDSGVNNLARNNGNGTFTDVTVGAGVEAADKQIYGGSFGLVSWGTIFVDLNNDGLEDLVVPNGGAPESLFPGAFGETYKDKSPNYIYINQGYPEKFAELHTQLGITFEGFNRGAAVSDYDDDGDMDILIGVLHSFRSFYRNDLNNGHRWLKVKARGTIGNADALGARIRATGDNGKSLMREVDGGSTFLSMNTKTAHFGLGSTVTRLEEVVVTFLGGLSYELRRVNTNQTLEVIEPIYLTSPSVETASIPPGGTLLVDFTVENLTEETATFDCWVDVVRPDESEALLNAPIVLTLDPHEVQIFPVLIDPLPGAEVGEYDVIGRVGTYPDQVIHQSFIDVNVE